MDDPSYDLNKDVVDGKLVPLGENVDTVIEKPEDGPGLWALNNFYFPLNNLFTRL